VALVVFGASVGGWTNEGLGSRKQCHILLRGALGKESENPKLLNSLLFGKSHQSLLSGDDYGVLRSRVGLGR
jgi:hypothetical protein